MRSRIPSKRGGFSLVESMLAVSVLGLLAAVLVESSASMGSLSTTGNVRSRLQLEGQRALERILDDLRASGEVSLTGGLGVQSFPHVFDDGLAGAGFEVHSFEPHEGQAEPGDPDFGPSRSVVLVLPAEDDGDGRPDLDERGGLVWGADEISYSVRTQADGRNVLQRRVDAQAPRTVGRFVERAVFDTHASSGFAIPRQSVRIRLFLRELGPEGEVHRHEVEATVRLRNSPNEL